jgi:hypothetical protein
MGKRRLCIRPLALAISLAVTGLLLTAADSAAYPSRVLLKTPSSIDAFSLDASGRAAWISVSQPFYRCYQVHRGDVRFGQDLPVGPCHPNDMDGSHHVATTLANGRQRILWAYTPFGGNTETNTTLWATTFPGGQLTRLASTHLSCGAGGCFAPGGSQVGPLAAGGGVVLYSVAVSDVTCAGSSCDQAITGGRIRNVSFDAAGRAHLATVAGAPPAVLLATAGGVLADLPYATGTNHAAGAIELRRVSDGSLLSTIPASGTVGAMAMSSTQLAVIFTDAQGTRHLVRFAIPGGAKLGSIPLRRDADMLSLGIFRSRIVFQTAHAIRVLRTDLGRTTTIHRQSSFRSNLSIDRYGVRWTALQRHPDGMPFWVVAGVDLAPLP